MMIKRFGNKQGFTIIEMLVVIAIIGVLAAIGIVAFTTVQTSVRNTQRSSEITVLSEALEKYYDQNGEYPSCSLIANPVSSSTVANNVLKGLDPDVLTAPSATQGTNSLTCGEPITDTYSYIESSGIQYTLKYKNEGSADIISIKSRRRAPVVARNLTVTAGANGTVTFDAGPYTSESTPTITAIPNANYSFDSWTGCSGSISHTVDLSTGDKTCVANFIATPITTPVAPTVTANTVGTDTTWSWGATSCPGNTARYQYQYTISPSGFDSGLTATALTSVSFTTSTEGQTYKVDVQAQCYNGATSSSWSTPVGSDSYLRPITYKTLTIVAGANGTVNAGGSFATGSIQTITATPNANYSFSSWTGDTGCSGIASHTITMNADKTCTANFVYTTYTLTIVAGAGGTVNAGGTYNSGTSQTITATPNAFYSFSSWTGSTGCSGVASHSITMDANKSCTANFTPTPIIPDPPAAPTVTANTVGATTTWSWGATSCPGNTARYQYRYTISPAGYDSGWTATALTSVGFTSSTDGQTYDVVVQSQCYNAATSTGWSVSSASAPYYRPIPMCTLTISAGANGTVNTAVNGSYDCGDTPAAPTITATPNANYQFSSWTGSTGCSGIASHTITMDAAKTCTANFTIITYTLTIAASTGGTVNAGGTYNSGTSQTITATPSALYSFSSWTGSTGCSGVASHSITMDANKSCTANFTPTPISAPSAPTGLMTGTAGGTTTWSWNAVSCPGNSVRYYYTYTISTGYNSGLVGPQSNLSVGFTTSSSGTYTVAVQAQCYNAVTSSSLSGASSLGVTFYTLTLIANNGGDVTGGGLYALNANATMTATWYPTMVFGSWTGSTGCAGTSSHSIVMNGDKSCTANFTRIWYDGLYGSLAGKYVYVTDLGSLYAYRTTNVANGTPAGAVGADAGTPADNALVNPQTNPGVSFINYPAQDACKAIGGRLPYFSESYDLYLYQGNYGNNFNTSAGLRTANQNPLDGTQARNRNMGTGSAAVSAKTNTNPVRCIKD